MQYSDTTNKNGIIQMEEALCGLGDGGISNDAVLLKQFTGYNNAAYFEIWMAEMSVDNKAKSDDYNYSDIPDAPITLVVGQSDYTLPVATVGANVATFVRLNGIYYTVGGFRVYLAVILDNDEYITTNGVPTSYGLNGKSFTFNCPPTTEFVAEHPTMHVEFQRVPDAFLSTDTTQQPGFMQTYHDLIPLKASAIYLLPANPQLAQLYEQRFLSRLELFKRDIARFDDSFDSRPQPEGISFR